MAEVAEGNCVVHGERKCVVSTRMKGHPTRLTCDALNRQTGHSDKPQPKSIRGCGIGCSTACRGESIL